MRRRVLVEERVVEHEPGAPDARRRVDERDLAETRCAVVRRDVRLHELLALVGTHVDRAAALESHLEAAHDVALHLERIGRPDDAVGALRVRGREHLFGGHVRDVVDPVRVVECGLPRGRGVQPDREVGAGPAVAERVEPPLVERRRAPLQVRDVLTPRRDRVGLVETHRRRDGLPQALDIGLPEHGLRPALVRSGDDRPVAVAVGQPQARLRDLAHARARDARPVEVRVELRLGVAGDPHVRAALLREPVEPVDEPRRRPPERLVGCALDVRAAHVLIGVVDVDVARARAVRLARGGARERRVLDERADAERLPRLQVQADAHGQPRVRVKSLACLHGATI